MDRYTRDKEYLARTEPRELIEFVRHFSTFENEPKFGFLKDNQVEIFRVSSKLLGMKSPELNSIAVDFYRAAGIESVSEHLVQGCLGSRKRRKRDLASKLLEEELHNPKVVESLIYGLNSQHCADKSKEILDNNIYANF